MRPPTILGFLFPKRYTVQFDMPVDLQWFQHEFEWRQDAWGGLKDVIKHPQDTRDERTGDCEDFAWVALSELLSEGREHVSLVFCWSFEDRVGHTVVADEDMVYGSDTVYPGNVNGYLRNSRYEYAVVRQIKPRFGVRLISL